MTNYNNDFFIIGGGQLQVKFINSVKQNGFTTHVFDYNPNCPGREISNFFYEISIDNFREILAIANKIRPIAIQTVATELGNLTACYVGEKMGLKNNSYSVALNTTNKSLMKKVLLKSQIPTANYLECIKLPLRSEINLEFPFLVKPSDRSASRGIMWVNDYNEFEQGFKNAMNESFNKIVLLEEYLDGELFSVETITKEGTHHILAVTEVYTNGKPNFVGSHKLMPARMPAIKFKKLEEIILRTLNAFEVQNGASHIELKFTSKEEFRIIEIASRMGGWRDELLWISLGIDYLSLIVNVAVGKEIIIKPTKHNYVVARHILNNNDFKRYLFFKENFALNFAYENIPYQHKVFQAVDLMGSQGIYCLETEELELVELFLNG